MKLLGGLLTNSFYSYCDDVTEELMIIGFLVGGAFLHARDNQTLIIN